MSCDAVVAVVILVDGLGWVLAERTGLLRDLLPQRAPIRSVLGYSSAAFPALLTGLPPARTGQWLLFKRGGEPGSLAGLARLAGVAERWPRLEPALRRAAAGWAIHLRGWPAHFSTFAIPFPEMRHLAFADHVMGWAPAAINGTPTLFGHLRAAGITTHAFGYPTPDQRSLASAMRHIDAGHAGMYLLYLWQLDDTLHHCATDPLQMAGPLASYAAGLEQLYIRAQARFGNVPFAVISDHGMATVRGGVDVRSHLAAQPAFAAALPQAFYDSTMARFWLQSESDRAAVQEALSSVPHAQLLDESRLAAEGVLFRDGRFGELFLLMDEGWVINPSYYGAQLPAGMHGYDPDAPDSLATLLTNVEAALPTDLYGVHRFLLDIIAGMGRHAGTRRT